MKITPSPLFGSASGKLGSLVFSRNAAGPFIRVKVTPVNHRSNAQVNHRQALSSASAMWCTLSESEKAQWNSYAKDPVRFAPIYKMNNGGINGLDAYVAHSLQCYHANLLKNSVTSVTSTPTGITHNVNAIFSVPNNPPNVPVDGTIFGIPIMCNVTCSYTGPNYTFSLFIAPQGGNSNPIPIPGNADLKDGHGNTIGFALYISNSKKNVNNYSQKLRQKVVSTGTFTNGAAPLNLTGLQIVSVYNPSGRNFVFPREGEYIDITIAMLSTTGQARKIGQVTALIQ